MSCHFYKLHVSYLFIYFVYCTGDIIGKALAYISLSPVIILVSFATLILFRRELHTVRFDHLM